MILSILAIAATTFAVTQHGNAPAPEASPLAAQVSLPEGLLPPLEFDPRHLAGLVRSEPRDESWAAPAEAALRARYAALAARGQLVDLRIVCAKTACEAVGKLIPTDVRRLNRLMRALQSGNVLDPAARLENVSMTFNRDSFASHWRRATGPTKAL